MNEEFEMKYFDVSLNTSSSTTWTNHVLSPYVQGDTENEYEGREYSQKRLIVSFQTTPADGTPPVGNLMDVWLVQVGAYAIDFNSDERQQRGNWPNILDGLPVTPGGLEDCDIKVIKRWKIDMQVTNNLQVEPYAVGDVPTNSYYLGKPKRYRYDTGMHNYPSTKFLPSNSSLFLNGYFMLVHRSDSAVIPHPALQVYSRCYYVDP